jgi:hypothetical protein
MRTVIIRVGKQSFGLFNKTNHNFRVVDPDPIESGFRDYVDPDPYWESGSRPGARKLRNFSGKMHF